MGVLEDLIAVAFATSYSIDLRAILIATAVAVPFAIIREIIVDHKNFSSN